MMTPLRKRTRVLLTILAIFYGVSLAFLLFVEVAEGHTPDRRACTIAWQQAPVGGKWQARQRCLAAQRRHLLTHPCPTITPRARVKGRPVGSNQRHVITWVLNEARRRQATRMTMIAAVITTTQEASAREIPYGHGTSVGPYQLIDDHGPAYKRVTVEFSGDWFLDRAIPRARRYGSPGALSQAVQASAHPSAYDRWVPEARRTVAAFLESCP